VSTRRNFLCVREVGSWLERYLSVEAVVPTGREHSTERGVWDVWVEAGVPRSNSVRRDVLPEPLGPSRRMEGNVVSPLALKTTVWRKIGIVKTSRSAMMRPTGDGLIKACAQS